VVQKCIAKLRKFHDPHPGMTCGFFLTSAEKEGFEKRSMSGDGASNAKWIGPSYPLRPGNSDVHLSRHGEGIIGLDAEIADGAL
jgi:hypothetical protein